MESSTIKAPPPAHEGWDIEFTKLAGAVGGRVHLLLDALGRYCSSRGHRVHIAHGLQDMDVSAVLYVADTQLRPVARVLFILSNGWNLCQFRGARLDGMVQAGGSDAPMFVPLNRYSDVLSADAEEVFYAAGEWVSLEHLQDVLAPLL